ncbi:MAG: hypothetical protein V4635_06340 [Bacteroidota bacterium]
MLTIQKGMKISTLQKKFNADFPFLKLEFFKHPHKVNRGNNKKDQVRSDSMLVAAISSTKEAELVITADLTVAAVEQMIMDNFGLPVQVFRKSGRSWLETTLTDDWTLRKQNQEGLELSGYTR